MTSITKIFILITTIIVISGETLNLSNKTGQSADEELARIIHRNRMLELGVPYMKRDMEPIPLSERRRLNICVGIVGYVNCDTRDSDVAMRAKKNSFNTKYIGIMRGSQRIRRQNPVKTKDSDDGPNSIMPLLTRSSFPLRSMIRKRNRRSFSTPETSSNENTTVKPVARPPPGSNRPPKLSYKQRLLSQVLASFTSPYLFIVPNLDDDKDYDKSGKIYYS